MNYHSISNQSQGRYFVYIVLPLSIVRVYHTHELIKFIVLNSEYVSHSFRSHIKTFPLVLLICAEFMNDIHRPGHPTIDHTTYIHYTYKKKRIPFGTRCKRNEICNYTMCRLRTLSGMHAHVSKMISHIMYVTVRRWQRKRRRWIWQL